MFSTVILMLAAAATAKPFDISNIIGEDCEPCFQGEWCNRGIGWHQTTRWENGGMLLECQDELNRFDIGSEFDLTDGLCYVKCPSHMDPGLFPTTCKKKEGAQPDPKCKDEKKVEPPKQ